MYKPDSLKPGNVLLALALIAALSTTCSDQRSPAVRNADDEGHATRAGVDSVPDPEWNQQVGSLVTPEASRTAYDFLRAKNLPNSWGIQLIKCGLSMGMLTGDRESLADLFGMVLRTSEDGGGTLEQVQRSVLDIEPAVIQLEATFRYDRTRARTFVAGVLAARMTLRKLGEDELAEDLPGIASAFASRERRTRLYGVMSAAGVDPGLLRAALEQGEFTKAMELFMQTASNLERAGDQAELNVLNDLRSHGGTITPR